MSVHKQDEYGSAAYHDGRHDRNTRTRSDARQTPAKRQLIVAAHRKNDPNRARMDRERANGYCEDHITEKNPAQAFAQRAGDDVRQAAGAAAKFTGLDVIYG